MKIRFGVGLGVDTDLANFAATVDRIEAAGIDSIWLSEQVYSPSVDPMVGLAFALARTTQLKVGTSVAILPGRHPVLVAKQLVSLAGLAPRRVLPAFGLQPARPAELALFPASPGRRADLFDESLALLREAITGEPIDFTGEFFTVRGAQIGPPPQRPLDIWLGGSAPAGLRRVGRYADGWLGSLLTPDEAGRAVKAINQAAADARRTIEADHFGLSVPLAPHGIPSSLIASIERRNPGHAPAELIATSWPHLHELIDGYLAGGLTKFIVRTVGETTGSDSVAEFLDRFATELLPRQN